MHIYWYTRMQLKLALELFTSNLQLASICLEYSADATTTTVSVCSFTIFMRSSSSSSSSRCKYSRCCIVGPGKHPQLFAAFTAAATAAAGCKNVWYVQQFALSPAGRRRLRYPLLLYRTAARQRLQSGDSEQRQGSPASTITPVPTQMAVINHDRMTARSQSRIHLKTQVGQRLLLLEC